MKERESYNIPLSKSEAKRILRSLRSGKLQTHTMNSEEKHLYEVIISKTRTLNPSKGVLGVIDSWIAPNNLHPENANPDDIETATDPTGFSMLIVHEILCSNPNPEIKEAMLKFSKKNNFDFSNSRNFSTEELLEKSGHLRKMQRKAEKERKRARATTQ